MQKSSTIIAAAFLITTASGCAQEAGEISRDTQPFDGIAETASVFLIGNEPFWSIDIEPDKSSGESDYSMQYSTPENIDGTAIAATRFAGNNGIGFSGELRGEPIQITLTPGKCDDTMSDRSYPYTATALVEGEVLYGCAYTSDEPFSGGEMP